MLKENALSLSHQAAIDGSYDMYVEPLSYESLVSGQTHVFVQVPEPFDMPGGIWFRFKRHGIEVSPDTW